MKFASADTTKIDLKNGHWIEVKNELGKGEQTRYRSAGLGRMSQRAGNQNEVDVDWAAMAMARVVTYLVDWSAVDSRGKSIAVSRSAVESLDPESFDEIDEAIKQHMEAREAEKKAPSGSPTPTTLSA